MQNLVGQRNNVSNQTNPYYESTYFTKDRNT